MVKFDKSDFEYSDNIKCYDCPTLVVELKGFSEKGLNTLKENNWHLVIPDEIDGLPVRFIGSNAFEDCGIEVLTLGNNISFIGGKAFKGNSIRLVKFPDSMEFIDSEAFAFNKIEEIVNLKKEVTVIANAFTTLEKDSYELKEEEIDYELIEDNSGEKLAIINGINNVARTKAFVRKGIVIPDEISGIPVKTISSRAFEDLGVKHVQLPKYLENIYPRAFNGNKLSEVLLPKTIKHISVSAFETNIFYVELLFNRREELKW